ncbi:MAG: cell division protein FtsZ [Candidatus Hydrothermarchaeota archaeon]|nr:cell division protein FtsZ [Candidatus Hydrothermarchaeota archaeon]
MEVVEAVKKSKFGTSIPKVELDEELEKILAKARARIVVIGTGGAGNNTMSRLMEVGIEGADTVAVNTDAQDLLYTYAKKKVLIGRELTGGLGAGSIPQIGEEAAKESENDLKAVMDGADLVFITCGLGGGTGTGSAPVIANVAQKLGALSVAIVTFPFAMEGNRRRTNAEMGLEKLRRESDTVIIIPNDKLLEIAPNLPLPAAFKVADEILVRAVKGIAELITKPGLINLDFADVRAIMEGGGVAMIGMGESDTENRAAEAIDKAINSPLLSVDITGAKGALVNVVGGEDLTLAEAEQVVEVVSERLDPKANIIWGAQIENELKGLIRVMLVITGVRSRQILGPEEIMRPRRETDLRRELGIDFIE